MNWQARRHQLTATKAGEDLLVYDHGLHVIHQLNPLAAFVWQRAAIDVPEVTLLSEARSFVDPDTSASTLHMTLSLLAQAGLVSNNNDAGMVVSRRRVLRHAAIGGIAIPAVISVTAPMAARASSTLCTSPPAPSVILSLRPTDTPSHTLFTISISGFCPLTTYPASLRSPWSTFWSGTITTDEGRNAVIEPSPSFSCSGGGSPNRFWGEAGGVSSAQDGQMCS